MTSQAELKEQLKELMALPENMHCLDCGDKRPMWASLIVPPPGSPFKEHLGCFCCYQCSGAHRRMGVHICFVRSTNLDEWKEKELSAMRDGGNRLINAMYEANLSDSQKAVVKPDNRTEMDSRSSFIYEKYQDRKWYNEKGHGSKPKKKSAFVPPAPIDGGSKSSFEEDFFASRATLGSADGWLEASSGESLGFADEVEGPAEIHFDPDYVPGAANQSNSRSQFDVEGLSNEQDGFRIESQSRILEDIKELEIDADNPMPSPKRLSQNRKKIVDSDGCRKSNSNASSASSKSKLVRKGSTDSYDSAEDRRSGRKSSSREPEDSRSGRRKAPPSRTKSMGSHASTDRPPRRHVKRTDSDADGSESCSKPKSERIESSRSRSSRESSRGVDRNRSKGVDSEKAEGSKSQGGPRRGVRRATSDTSALSGSAMSCDSSVFSSRSRGDDDRRRPRRQRSGDDASQTSRRTRDDDSQSSRRRRSPKRSTGSSDRGSTSRSQSPAPSKPSSRRRRSPKRSTGSSDMGSTSRSPSPTPSTPSSRRRRSPKQSNGSCNRRSTSRSPSLDSSKPSSRRRNRRSPGRDSMPPKTPKEDRSPRPR